jgi:hypothetical protein
MLTELETIIRVRKVQFAYEVLDQSTYQLAQPSIVSSSRNVPDQMVQIMCDRPARNLHDRKC